MDGLDTRASTKKRKAREAPETLVEANKKTKLYNTTNRSSHNAVGNNQNWQEEDTATLTTTDLKITKASSAKKSAPKARVNASKTGSKISKATTKLGGDDAQKVAETKISKYSFNLTKPLKRKSIRDGSDEELESRVPAKKAKVGESLKGEATGGIIVKARTPGRTVGDTEAIIVDSSSESSESSESEDETQITAPEEPIKAKVCKDKPALDAGREKPTKGKLASNASLGRSKPRIPSMRDALDEGSIDVVENTVQAAGAPNASGAKGVHQGGNDGTSSQTSKFSKAQKIVINASEGEGENNQGKTKAKIPHKGSKNRKASKDETSTNGIVEVDEDHKTPNSEKAKDNLTTSTKSVAISVGQEAGGVLGRGGSASGNDLPSITSGASSLEGRTGRRTSGEQISNVEPPRNPFIVSDPNKPRPRGLGRAHFEETPAYKNLMEVANLVKRAARILTKKLVSAKAASKDSSTDALPNATADACEKVEKFLRIYSPQVKFLNTEEYMGLLKAAVQCLGDVETSELPDHDFQKVLCTFLDGMKLSESQAITLGLYPILELYKADGEFGEINPDVMQLIASINASLVKRSKAAEERLVDPDYVPEDYLAKMQKRILAMGNVSKPISDDWERFLKDSAPPSSTRRAQRLSLVDQVIPTCQPLSTVTNPKPTKNKGNWEKNHMVSKLISRDRSNRRLEKKMRNVHKIVREHKTYEAEQDDGEPMVHRSCRRPARFDDTEEARQILEYDAYGRPIGLVDAEQAGESMVYSSFDNTLQF
ncbi:hypothetical protein C7212DRAFT_364751 [Tuber magnatum]|uniref:Uncharacterized protein n=1 Tax=Tuber magnatum TaxID=42249 RepID=A0A317SMU8_9PEZI|nr:hypothetical protein C7212DRAFT_364751 [Tuber magnatum]